MNYNPYLILISIVVIVFSIYYRKIFTKTYKTIKSHINMIYIIIISINAIYYWFKVKDTSQINNDYTTNSSHAKNNNLDLISDMIKNKRAVTPLMKKTVAAKQSWKCGICGRLLDETFEVDHIVPLYMGGTNSTDNLMALDPICHKKKTFKQQYSNL